MPTFATMSPKYTEWLKRAVVRPQWQGAIERAAKKCVAGMARYKAVESQTGVPWAWIAAAHMRESGNDFRGVLHNGEHIIGTGRKTRLVPSGHGPFDTWEGAAIHALKLKNLDAGDFKTMEDHCWQWERFNGFGYADMGRPSPYVWSGTNIYSQGKYVRDGVYSSSTVDQQLGCYAVYLRTLEMAGEGNVRSSSRKLGLLAKARTTIRVGLTAAGGLFTADSFGVVKEWFGTASGIMTATNLVTIVVIAGAAWWLINVLDKLMMEDHADGRWTPSGNGNPTEGAPPLKTEEKVDGTP